MFKFALSALVCAFLSMAPSPEVLAAGEGQGARHYGETAKKAQIRKRSKIVLNKTKRRASRERLERRVVTANGKRKVIYERVARKARVFAPIVTMGDLAGLHRTRDPLDLKSSVAFVLDENSSEVLFEKNANVALPIASITKLMTGLVVVEAKQDMDEILTITDEDVDREKHSTSRLKVGTRMTRANMLHIALMSSENRAASALGRHYPGGLPAFVNAMNAKARALGMNDTHYVDSSGLSSRNVASARDLAKLVKAASHQPILREYSTAEKAIVQAGRSRMQFGTTNYLVTRPEWQIGVQKTGFINEAGRCLVMQAVVAGRNVVMVFLDSKGKQSRTGDANRMRKWLETLRAGPVTVSALPEQGGSVDASLTAAP
ncbi:D-alanyl-D-alanine endopeptidase [Pseudoduganella sp. GCM10020061]|jgi:D-alanyl-D-alanine endopeptidase (penicillin-binding protein 7)|uniref:D-alanyl-D-alanine endopeptidase n=1 Tax=Pseudoduganella sp. GCM10020061 TaxID=3317345 RepID=UPI003639418B